MSKFQKDLQMLKFILSMPTNMESGGAQPSGPTGWMNGVGLDPVYGGQSVGLIQCGVSSCQLGRPAWPHTC